MAKRYGITAIPTAILVDQAGKIVSLEASGDELPRLLTNLIGAKEEDTPDGAEHSSAHDEGDE